FAFVPTGDFLSYGNWLAEAREPKFFRNLKVTVRKVLGKKLHGTFICEPMAIDQSLYILISPTNDSKQLKFILGILMSGIGAWYLRTKYAIYDTLYPWYTKKQLAAFPIKPPDDKLVGLVDKMLVLVPKLRAAQNPSEQQTLQNAVTATDQQIDQLVYDLYGLTEEEIKLVEGSK
ncbi:MAG: TaqI-like C-terminal specificity domain-containing protein, partial [Limisphaerales bacterium]